MNKSVLIYGGILVLALGAAWRNYTSDETAPKEGVVLVDNKKTDLERVVYRSPDTEAVLEFRKDDAGSFTWVTVTENKKKKENGVDVVTTKITKFKAGSQVDKVVESLSPLMALRSLDSGDDAKLESFGLVTPDTTMTVTGAGRTVDLSLGGETYGTKDRYVREVASGRVYVVDDEVFKPLKFAVSRIPERGLFGAKKEEIESFSLGQAGNTVTWTQKNIDDKAAAFWDRAAAGGAPVDAADANPAATAGGKDETFGNWFDTVMKLKSTAYVQDAEQPVDPALQYEFTVTSRGKPKETVQVFTAGDDWFAKSEFTRGLVKLSKTSAVDVAGEVDDILEGRIPPAKAKPAAPSPHGGPPGGMSPGGMPPGMMPPGRPPGMPPMMPPPG